MSEDVEIKAIPLNQDLVQLVNRILDQNHQIIELNSRILEENARILTLLDFPKFSVNSLPSRDATWVFRKWKYYGGWLYTNKDEIEKLKALGVFGPMVWKPDEGKVTKALGKTGTLSHCYCDENTLQKLDDLYAELWRTRYPYYDEFPSMYPSEHFSEIKKGNGENT